MIVDFIRQLYGPIVLVITALDQDPSVGALFVHDNRFCCLNSLLFEQGICDLYDPGIAVCEPSHNQIECLAVVIRH